MATLKIGDRLCGDGHPVYVACEIGGTMTGLVSAVKLVHAAADAGADAIKVQLVDPDRLIGPDADPPVAFRDATGVAKTEPQREALRRRVLPEKGWRVVAQAARERGLDLIATVDFPESVSLAERLGAAAFKICSGDIAHRAWIRQVAASGRPVLLDTGHASLGELEAAVDVCLAERAPVMIHHVPGGYPATLEQVNLRVIATLRAVFGDVAAIGYSCHSAGGWDFDMAAVTLGASMLEKNLTLDRQGAGPEQAAALEPGEAAQFVAAIRRLEVALGHRRRRLGPADRVARAGARRSAWLKHPLPAGVMLTEADVEWRRPANAEGFEPHEAEWVYGRTLARDRRGFLRREDLA